MNPDFVYMLIPAVIVALIGGMLTMANPQSKPADTQATTFLVFLLGVAAGICGTVAIIAVEVPRG